MYKIFVVLVSFSYIYNKSKSTDLEGYLLTRPVKMYMYVWKAIIKKNQKTKMKTAKRLTANHSSIMKVTIFAHFL